VVKNHQSVNWLEYFKGIQTECPWSLRAYQQGAIDIVNWADTDTLEPLGEFQARIYCLDLPNSIVEAMATELDCQDLESEWLFSYPGYGDYATPVTVLIQQDRARLAHLRKQLGCPHAQNKITGSEP
jgi:hypothetical protein